MKTFVEKIMIWALCVLFLTGLTFGGTGFILCIGSNGHIEYEAIYNTCCGDEICDIDISDNPDTGHNDCSDCSDIELDSLLISKVVRNDYSDHLVQFVSVLITDNIPSSYSTLNCNSHIIKYCELYGINLPSFSGIITTLRC
jgi:hypothetical protein